MRIITFGYVLGAAAFLWSVGATVLCVGRRKLFGLAVVALLFGLMTGFLVAWELYIPELRADLGDRLEWLQDQELLATTISYGALHNLENGKDAEAKSSLANQVIRHYRQLKSAQRLSSRQKQLLDTLVAAIAKSETLKQKLKEPEPH
jgi:hypothetical protein